MKKIMFYIMLMNVSFMSFGQAQPFVFRTFGLYGEKQILENNYSIYFVYQDESEKVIYKPTIQNDTFYIPKMMLQNQNIKYYFYPCCCSLSTSTNHLYRNKKIKLNKRWLKC